MKCAITLPPVTMIPEKPSLEGLEAKWRARWEADGTYRFAMGESAAQLGRTVSVRLPARNWRD